MNMGCKWCNNTCPAEVEFEIARLKAEIEADKRMVVMQTAMNWQNTLQPVPYVKMERKTEDKHVKEPKSPFEYRVELWNAVNEEIKQVEEFLSKASTKKFKGWFFRVSCFEKNHKGFTVHADYNMELPMGLQEKMIRVAEEYLEELKNQRKDMEQGYE